MRRATLGRVELCVLSFDAHFSRACLRLAGYGNEVTLLHASDGTKLGSLKVSAFCNVRHVAFSADGSYVVAADDSSNWWVDDPLHSLLRDKFVCRM